MSLFVTDILFRDFRNYEVFKLCNIGKLTIFVGQNAKGKTNIVEGLQLLTTQTSFKGPTSQQLIKWGSEQSSIQCCAEGEGRQLDFSTLIQKGKKRYEINGKVKSAQNMKGILPSVVFTPDDLKLVKGAQEAKRSSIDALGSQITPNYHTVRRDYEKILRHKNRLLKDQCDQSLLDAIDETMVTVGSQLFCYRNALFDRLKKQIEVAYKKIAGDHEEATALYYPSWVLSRDGEDQGEEAYHQNITKDEVRNRFERTLYDRRAEEQLRKRALVGPHADRIEFYIERRNARSYGSQGQQRSIVLSFKLAEIEVLKETLGKSPILLLDDVMSELDEKRRKALIEAIADSVQTFITTTTIQYFDYKIQNSADLFDLNQDITSERMVVQR